MKQIQEIYLLMHGLQYQNATILHYKHYNKAFKEWPEKYKLTFECELLLKIKDIKFILCLVVTFF